MFLITFISFQVLIRQGVNKTQAPESRKRTKRRKRLDSLQAHAVRGHNPFQCENMGIYIKNSLPYLSSSLILYPLRLLALRQLDLLPEGQAAAL